MNVLRSITAAALMFSTALASVFAAEPLAVGRPAPSFTYHLLDGRRLPPGMLRGHPYVLWMVATWCPSCKTGSNVIASHIAFLRAHGVRVVEMQLAGDLGRPGPGLESFQKAVGTSADSPNWYWGELTQAQTVGLDPSGDMDRYYLVNARGTIVAVSGNPALTWDAIARFASAAPGRS